MAPSSLLFASGVRRGAGAGACDLRLAAPGHVTLRCGLTDEPVALEVPTVVTIHGRMRCRVL
jgi:hypothetical protein